MLNKKVTLVSQFSQFNEFLGLKLCKLNKQGKLCKLFLFCFLLFTFYFLLYALSLEARVTGVCSNCHTMHNSQNGSAVVAEGPQPNLLSRAGCLGCHSATNGTTWKDPITNAPIVFNTSAPQYGASSDGGTTPQGLAGGNFYWVQTEDTKGHNVFANNPDNNLSVAPGTWGFSTCGTNACHGNIHGTVSGCSNANLNGRQGCTKCHMMSDSGKTSGYHHADDGTGTKYVNTAAKGWYRFISGHSSGNGHGVEGIEDEDWQKTSSVTDHNEYLGAITNKTSTTLLSITHTTTGFCCGCHGMFHHQDSTGTGASPWLMHPADFALPTSGEYAAYTTYDPLAPAARPSGFNWAGGPSSTVSGTNGDMVMCLSCHRAHGSPYFKMLRWDYKGWPASGGTNGCNVCHTWKD